MGETTRAPRARTGLDIVGCYAFGSGPAHADEPRFVVETVEVVPGRLGEVTPAFAWDEGEDDGTLESWREGDRGWGVQLGIADPDGLEVPFHDERWPVDALPALVCGRADKRVGVMSFRPRPEGVAVVFALDAADSDIDAALQQGLAELGRRHGWKRIVAPDRTTEPS